MTVLGILHINASRHAMQPTPKADPPPGVKKKPYPLLIQSKQPGGVTFLKKHPGPNYQTMPNKKKVQRLCIKLKDTPVLVFLKISGAKLSILKERHIYSEYFFPKVLEPLLLSVTGFIFRLPEGSGVPHTDFGAGTLKIRP